MNEYQEALNNIIDFMDIKEAFYGEDNISNYNRFNVYKIQKLIDAYSHSILKKEHKPNRKYIFLEVECGNEYVIGEQDGNSSSR